LPHDSLDVVLDFVVRGNQNIQPILLDYLEVLRRIYASLVKDTCAVSTFDEKHTYLCCTLTFRQGQAVITKELADQLGRASKSEFRPRWSFSSHL